MQISLLMSGLTPCCFQETGHPDTECQEEENDGQVRKTAHLGLLHHQEKDKIEVRSPVEEADPVPGDGDRGVLRDGPGDDPPLLAPLHGVQTHQAADRYR